MRSTPRWPRLPFLPSTAGKTELAILAVEIRAKLVEPIANTVPINNIACSVYHCMFKTATEINHARHYCSTASFGAAIRIGEYDASINSILMFRS